MPNTNLVNASELNAFIEEALGSSSLSSSSRPAFARLIRRDLDLASGGFLSCRESICKVKRPRKADPEWVGAGIKGGRTIHRFHPDKARPGADDLADFFLQAEIKEAGDRLARVEAIAAAEDCNARRLASRLLRSLPKRSLFQVMEEADKVARSAESRAMRSRLNEPLHLPMRVDTTGSRWIDRAASLADVNAVGIEANNCLAQSHRGHRDWWRRILDRSVVVFSLRNPQRLLAIAAIDMSEGRVEELKTPGNGGVDASYAYDWRKLLRRLGFDPGQLVPSVDNS